MVCWAMRGRSNQLACFLDASGRSYSLPSHSLPSARSLGEPLTGRFSIPSDTSVVGVAVGSDEQTVLLASNQGYGFVTALSNLHTRQKAGKQILSVPKGGQALSIETVADPKEGILLAVTSAGYLLAFYVEELPQLAKGKGNKIINIPAKARAEGEHMVGAVVLAEGGSALVWAGQRYLKITWNDTDHYWGERAQRGRKLPRGFQKVTGLTLAE